MRKLLLQVAYYVLFVPVAWVVRRFRDPLDRRWEPERASYWTFEPGFVPSTPEHEREAEAAAAYR